MFLRVWAVALIVALLLQPVVARGGLAEPIDASSLQETSSVDVVLTEYSFGPSDPVVSAGLIRLRIINAGIRRHSVVMLVDGVELTSPEARPGDIVEWELQIDRPGQYQFWCGEYRHLEKGMTGTLIVD